MRFGYLILLVFLFSSVNLFSQTREDLMRLGNDAYEKGNYASAAYFYNKIATGSNSGVEETVYPYDLKHSNRVKEIKIDSLPLDTTTLDSLSIDTSTVSIRTTEVNQDSATTSLNLSSHEVEMFYVYHKLAESYRRDFNYDHAEPWFAKATKSPHPEFPLALFYYGEILINNEKYGEARDLFSEIVTNTSSDGELGDLRNTAKQRMKSCNFALSNNGEVSGASVTKLDSVTNNGTAIFGATYFGEESVIAFSSATIHQNSSNEEDNYNLYLSSVNGEKWDAPDKIQTPLSSSDNEATICINPKGDRVYFTRWNASECAIYASNRFNGKWMEPYKLKDINADGVRTMNPNLSPDGHTMYFSSNRDGGKGGMDIWKCAIDNWGNPKHIENMDAKINTSGDEISPFIHPNGIRLYFSSNGHVGYGGYDIFYSEEHEEYGWTHTKNLGKPYNSSRDDSYYITSHDAKHGFLSSDRESCSNCGHGNCMKLYYYDNGPPRFFLDGFVFNSDTDEEIPGAKVTIRDVKKDSVIAIITTDETGYYSQELKLNHIYFIKGQKQGFFGDANSASTMGLTESRSFMVDLFLTPIPLGEVDIPGIEYDYDKATLRDTSKIILDELYDFLVLNDNLKVELRSHTDHRGSHEYNMNLSQQRANSCVKYLLERGINPKRVVPVGLGETDPKVADAQTEEDHQRNRRTAFFVVGQNFHE